MSTTATYCNQCGASNPVQATHCFACSAALYAPTSSTPSGPLVSSTHVPFAPVSVPANAIFTPSFNGPLAPSYLLHSRYSIVQQIGTGGFGAVYLAKDTLFSNRPVAIKEMNQDGLNPRELADATAAFEREALLLAELTHPNLPRIHDHFSEQGRSYVVMDYIAGETLEAYLGNVVQRISLEAALEIGLQLSTVLDYLHLRQPPLIFRDVKPENIMRTADNHIYLIDFGIARHFKPGKAKDTIPLGSKGYAAPEQYGKAQTTAQSDIYGLGATLHQLLTGDDPSLTLFHFEPLHLKDSPISSQFNDLLSQMVQMEMDKRPASMAVVKEELQRLLALQTAKRLSSMQRAAQGRTGRRKFLLGFASVVGVCAVSIAATSYVYSHSILFGGQQVHPLTGSTPVSYPSTPRAYSGPVRTLSQPLYTYFGHSGAVTAVAWSPDGQHIASAGTLDRSVQVWEASTGNIIALPVAIRDAMGQQVPTRKTTPAIFPLGKQRADTLAWSPDSTRIASACDNDTVDIWNIVTGEEKLFDFSPSGRSIALAWSPDGTRIAAVSDNSNIKIRSVTTGAFIIGYEGHTQAVHAIAWSPDGKRILSGGDDGIILIWDASTGITLVNKGGFAEIQALAWSPDGWQIATGGTGGLVQVYDNGGNPLFTYNGHAGNINALAWQPGSHLLPGHPARIASAADDGTVQVWSFGQAANAKPSQAMTLQGEILVYRGHTGPVISLMWAADGQHIVSGSADGTVQIWRAM